MTANEAIKIFTKSEKCATDDCPVTAGCDICQYNVSKEEYEEAIKMAITALKNFPTQMSGTSDLVSRQYLLDEYDRQHVGPPGGARKIIEEAPSVEVPNNPANSSEIPNSLDLISRQAALNALKEALPSLSTPDGAGPYDHEIHVACETFVDAMQIINDLPNCGINNS